MINGVIFQFFHWYHEGDLWNEFAEKASYLNELGITAVWLPPATKCFLGTEGRGYDVYDHYDLGEFFQKGTVRTRYGTKQEYLNAIQKAHECNIQVYADVVLNHKMGGDKTESVTVHEVDAENRTQKIGNPFQAETKTYFNFPGRNGMYSDFVWDYQCFSGIDIIKVNGEEKKGIFKIHNNSGTEWDDSASHQFGNYDYLMGADVEYRNPEVAEQVKNWLKWYLDLTKADGIRLDALKHISSDFLIQLIDFIKNEINEDCFIIGEYWKDKPDMMSAFSEKINHQISLFDVPLHYNFHEASKKYSKYDLRTILKNSFLEEHARISVSFVENHDTQPLQGLESSVNEWFKPLAYAIILLMEKAYPCVFYADFYGAEYCDAKDGAIQRITLNKVEILPKLLEARKRFALGNQINYFDHPNCIAWLRKGSDISLSCLVIISNGNVDRKAITLGSCFGKSKFVDFLGYRSETVECDENGKGTFMVNPKSVSIWVMES
ncbi:alpha-amylase [Chryseobacterium binzhouense]|uniref:alpha-amylase n=1 Tax=Chryseobacterium binzhouense TaxID=2593646 RepID=UPI001E4D7966|nr:alpha-amylase [Chryseobacterium binzhouense]